MRSLSILLMWLLVAIPVVCLAQEFGDDFESDLSQWVGKWGGAQNGVIVADPLNLGNNVLSFAATNNTGDVFSLEFAVSPGFIYELNFDYLSLPIIPSDQ